MTEEDLKENERQRVVATQNEILRGEVGSTAHGFAVSGQDDLDEMAVFVEPADVALGVHPVDHYVFRTAQKDAKSGPWDMDSTSYSLRRYLHLAFHGNPSVVLLLWLPQWSVKTEVGEKLVALRTKLISRESGKRFRGYLDGQLASLKGERAKKVQRPDLVEKYGYDTKFAAHAMRLGMQGIELLTTRHLSVPMRVSDLTIVQAVRGGKFSEKETIAMIESIRMQLDRVVSMCEIEADAKAVNEFSAWAHKRHWNRKEFKK